METTGSVKRGEIIERIEVSTYTIPTDFPESDGTFVWDATTILVVEARAGGKVGLGYTYTDAAAARLIDPVLRAVVEGREAMDVTDAWDAMARRLRNVGRPAMGAMAIAAIDTARWDPRSSPRHAARPGPSRRCRLRQWRIHLVLDGSALRAARGLGRHRHPAREDEGRPTPGAGSRPRSSGARGDRPRGGAVRRRERRVQPEAGPRVRGSLRAARRQLVRGARLLAGPRGAAAHARSPSGRSRRRGRRVRRRARLLPSDDRGRCRGRAPGRRDTLRRHHRATRSVRSLSGARPPAVAPALHLHPCCALVPVRHVEYFHDHVRIERMLFDGVVEPAAGRLHHDLSRPGCGLELKRHEAERFRVA